MAPLGELRGKDRCGVFAGKTVWSTPDRRECLRGEVLTTRCYTNLRLPYFTTYTATDQHYIESHWPRCESDSKPAPQQSSVVLSISCDYQTTPFHLRWFITEQLTYNWPHTSRPDANASLVSFVSVSPPPYPPLGLIWTVMLVWRKGNINRTVSVLSIV